MHIVHMRRTPPGHLPIPPEHIPCRTVAGHIGNQLAWDTMSEQSRVRGVQTAFLRPLHVQRDGGVRRP